MKITDLVEQPPEAWQTLRRAIPDGVAKAVADRLDVHPDYVRRWRREPLSVDAPLATGQRSALDRVDELVDVVFLVAGPSNAAFIVDHVAGRYHSLLRTSLEPVWDKRADTAEVLRETVDAVNSLNLDAPLGDTLQELIEARTAIDKAITHLHRSRRPVGGNVERQEKPESARRPCEGQRADSVGGRG